MDQENIKETGLTLIFNVCKVYDQLAKIKELKETTIFQLHWKEHDPQGSMKKIKMLEMFHSDFPNTWWAIIFGIPENVLDTANWESLSR